MTKQNLYKQQVQIGPLHWNIKPLHAKDSVDFDGLCSVPYEAEIFLEPSLIGERAIDVLLHECLHAIEHMYDVDITEELVGKLGTYLGKLFVQNPWMLTYIKEQVNNELRKNNGVIK